MINVTNTRCRDAKGELMRNGIGSLTTGDVAQYCDVTRQSVIRWIKEGKLKTHYRTPGGHYRIRKADLRDFLEQFDMPVEPAFFEEAP